MGKQAAPTPPDPNTTAAAQTASNVDTAKAQARLNAVNQVNPLGSLTYTAGPEVNGIPQYTATTSYSPIGQKLFDSSTATQQNLADLARDQSGRISGLLSQPFSLDNDAVEGRINELASKRLDPQLAQSRETELTRLANSGIKLGSTAYDRGVNLIDQKENDARNQLLLTGRQQAVSEALTARNQPINEILALAGQGQIGMPQFGSTPQTGVAGTDIAGLISQDYSQRLASYNQQQSDMMGGLFGLGKAGLSLLL